MGPKTGRAKNRLKIGLPKARPKSKKKLGRGELGRGPKKSTQNLAQKQAKRHAWLRRYFDVTVQYLTPGVSDHSPLIFTLQSERQQGGRPFKFMNVIIAEHTDFLDTVSKAWSSVNGNYKLQYVWLKLKVVKQALNYLQLNNFGKAHEKVEILRQ